VQKRKSYLYEDFNSSATQPVTILIALSPFPYGMLLEQRKPTSEIKIKLTTNLLGSTSEEPLSTTRSCPVLQMLLPQPELGHRDRHG
jgi:hypothetical protein